MQSLMHTTSNAMQNSPFPGGSAWMLSSGVGMQRYWVRKKRMKKMRRQMSDV